MQNAIDRAFHDVQGNTNAAKRRDAREQPPIALQWVHGRDAKCSPKAPTDGALQTLPACDDADEPFTDTEDKVAGFSLPQGTHSPRAGSHLVHAGVAAKAQEREKVRAGTTREATLEHKLERLCRYIARPAVSEKRLSLPAHGQVRYQLKTPYRDGTTHVAALAHPCASRH